MSRWLLRTASAALLMTGFGLPVCFGQSAPSELPSSDANPLLPGLTAPRASAPAAYPASTGQQVTMAAQQVVAPGATGPVSQGGYVQLNAPLYPSPQPNIPIWTGSTMITNQALAPHEMLYAHTYRAMYPPFYHRVKGKYFWTPFGMRTHEKWELQGTMVQVKYRSSWPMLGGGHPPVVSTHGGLWK